MSKRKHCWHLKPEPGPEWVCKLLCCPTAEYAIQICCRCQTERQVEGGCEA